MPNKMYVAIGGLLAASAVAFAAVEVAGPASSEEKAALIEKVQQITDDQASFVTRYAPDITTPGCYVIDHNQDNLDGTTSDGVLRNDVMTIRDGATSISMPLSPVSIYSDVDGKKCDGRTPAEAVAKAKLELTSIRIRAIQTINGAYRPTIDWTSVPQAASGPIG